MAEASVTGHPNITATRPHGLRFLVHADVLIRTMRSDGRRTGSTPERVLRGLIRGDRIQIAH
jgi:hypothetical protein